MPTSPDSQAIASDGVAPRPIRGPVRPRVSSFVALFAALFITLFAMTGSPVGALGSAHTTTLNESSNHRTVAVDPGARITVVLHSTYWSLVALHGSPVIAAIGRATVVATAPGAGSGCVPGQGCGTLTAHYLARHAGFVQLRATRTSCGEAMRCTPTQGHWTVIIHVR